MNDITEIAALYVETDGCYFGLPGVDPWDEARDARLYPGPHPVVAHPPCQRWGKLWAGQPLHIKNTGVRKIKGDDAGCFAAALAAVRKVGGGAGASVGQSCVAALWAEPATAVGRLGRG